MKRFNIIFVCTLLAMLHSCYKDDVLVSESTEYKPRYEFPQGNDIWDKEIIEIANTYGVYLIYDQFQPNDFNRVWTGGTSVSIGSPLKDEEQKMFYVNFMKHNLFKHLHPALTNRGMMLYYYLAYDMQEISVLGNMGQNWKFGGLDFTAICFETHPKSETDGQFYSQKTRPKTEAEFRTLRGVALNNAITTIFKREKIVAPDYFKSDFDYKTPIETLANRKDSANYYLKRGFSDRISSLTSFLLSTPSLVQLNPLTNCQAYVQLAIYHTRDEIVVKYEKYPKILNYYDLTVKYFKDKYDWDITTATEKPYMP